MDKLSLEVGKSYLSQKNKIIEITTSTDDPNYPFEGIFQGAVSKQSFSPCGKIRKFRNSEYVGNLVRAILSEDDLIDNVRSNPGIQIDQILKGVRNKAERLHIRHEMISKLLTENRLSVVRFTTYAPNLKTTFMYFATQHGRIEIINNKPVDFAGHQIGHVHDPMGKWDERMEEALAES